MFGFTCKKHIFRKGKHKLANSHHQPPKTQIGKRKKTGTTTLLPPKHHHSHHHNNNKIKNQIKRKSNTKISGGLVQVREKKVRWEGEDHRGVVLRGVCCGAAVEAPPCQIKEKKRRTMRSIHIESVVSESGREGVVLEWNTRSVTCSVRSGLGWSKGKREKQIGMRKRDEREEE